MPVAVEGRQTAVGRPEHDRWLKLPLERNRLTPPHSARHLAQARSNHWLSMDIRSTLDPPGREVTHIKIVEPDCQVLMAIRHLLVNDDHLFQHDVHERSITHRLACYLQEEFREWHVDCEYNRDCESKDDIKRDSNDKKRGRKIYPDIIVHKRGETQNLLAIEAKKRKTRRRVVGEADCDKLRKLLKLRRYKHALFLRFVVSEKYVECEWVCDCHHTLKTVRIDQVITNPQKHENDESTIDV